MTTTMYVDGVRLNLSRRLKKSFFTQPADRLARRLLGKIIVKREKRRILAGRIVETEAYLGAKDRASHAFGFRRTPRTEIMYAEGGTAYIYRIYGLCWCFNVVASRREDPQTVFVRALEPQAGLAAMKRRRGKGLYLLTNGPCRWTQSFALDKRFGGRRLYADPELFIIEGGQERFGVERDKRVGIDYAGEAKEWPLRFYIRGSRFVSVLSLSSQAALRRRT